VAVFDQYALYYDLFYGDKDYAAEAKFIENKLLKYAPGTRSIIDLGCGHGRHAIALATAGYRVVGVDISARMLDLAKSAVEHLPKQVGELITLVQGDVTNATNLGEFDAAVSLFHVSNYQSTNESLMGFFKTARSALRRGGVFVFDFWYGPAVLAERPERRIKQLQKDGIQLTRIATPEMDVDRNLVTVHYDISIADQTKQEASHIYETHLMRYLFLPEIEHYALSCGFKLYEAGKWMSLASLDDSCWYGYAILVAE